MRNDSQVLTNGSIRKFVLARIGNVTTRQCKSSAKDAVQTQMMLRMYPCRSEHATVLVSFRLCSTIRLMVHIACVLLVLHA